MKPNRPITQCSEQPAALADSRLLMLIASITLLKAALFIVVLPAYQESIGNFYGIGFADDYQVLAANLAAGNGFRFMADTALTLMREPGYPAVLALLFSVFGVSLTAARVLNLLLGIVSALLVARIVYRLTATAWPARLAAVLVMIHPGIVVSEVRGGVECLFIVLLLSFFLATFRALDSGRMRDYLIAGLVLGAASLVRGTALLFPPFLLAYFLLWERGRTPYRLMISHIAVVIAGATLVLSPWIVRNYLLVQKFAPTASVAGVSAHAGYYMCTHLTFDNQLKSVDEAAADERIALARQHGYRFKNMASLYYIYFYDAHDEVKFNNYLGDKVFKAYLNSPGLFASCVAKNAFNFWFAGKTWTSTALNAVVQLPYMLLGFAGLVFGLRGQACRQVFVLGLFVLYTMAVYLPILAQARYSVHVVPILSVFTALFVWGLRTRRATIKG